MRLYIIAENHRRPRFLGGTDSPYNMSKVEEEAHECWHILFGNMNPFQIANRINQMPDYLKPKKLKVFCRYIKGTQSKGSGGNNCKEKTIVAYAWNFLSRRMGFGEFIEYINNVLLDPSYTLDVKEIVCDIKEAA